MNFRKPLCAFLFLIIFFAGFTLKSPAQERSRIVREQRNNQAESQPATPLNKIPEQTPPRRLPILTNNITVQNQPLVKKTVSSQPVNAAPVNYVAKFSYSADFNQRLYSAITDRFGIPYRYGSIGPNTYDCSGLVWSVFQDAGLYFERASARNLWQESEPVEGADRFKFGTLVFFNNLGHIGIVADESGFYHASTSQGVTYSKFEGYWQNRIVGFRRLKIQM